MLSVQRGLKKWLWVYLTLVLVGLLVFVQGARAVAGQVDANNVATAPTINGQLTESGWSLANTVSKTTVGTPNNTVTMGAMWNSTYLFIGVRVLDANLNNDSANIWDDDSVEIFIDGNHNAGTTYDSFDRQFIKGYNDTTLFASGSSTGVQHAWAAITGGYSVELAIPWSNLGITPTSNMIIGFDIGYNDDDNAGARDSQAVWWGTINNYNNTSAFGDVKLMPSGTTPPTTPPPTTPPPTTPPPTTQPGQSAYPNGTPWAIPGTIQAENFDIGGEGVAYHDTDAANTGGQYRTSDGVDIEVTGDTGGGHNVGWTRTDEWLEYTVNVAQAGNYTVTERVASGATTGSLRIEFNGVNKTGTVTVPNTGGWQTYQNLTQTVSLSAGQQIMRIYFQGNDVNLNYVSFSTGTTPPPTTPPPTTPPPTTPPPTTQPGQSAYPNGVAWAIPGTIQAENFDIGGEGIAYHDTDAGNTGGQYRTSDGVDVEVTGDSGGGHNVGWTRTDEWLEYTVNVSQAGNYILTERVASGATTGSFRVEFNGVNKTGTVTVPNTGGWQTYQNLSQTVNLSAGQQVMRIYFQGNDTNLNYVSLVSGTVTPPPTTPPPTTPPPTTPPPTTPPPTTPPPIPGRGATLPYVELEAENAVYNGTLLVADNLRTFGHTNFATESSGRRSVQLNSTGQYVEFTSTASANSIVVRNSIPDSAGGGGIDATISLYVQTPGGSLTFLRKITLSSKHSWLYGLTDDTEGLSNTPISGQGRRLFDESHALLTTSYPAGTKFRLQRDSTDTASFYIIDLIDLEQVAPALTMPAGCVSITNYGAVPNDGLDDTAAIQAALMADQAGTISCVWIPAGEWRQEQKFLSPDPNRGQYNQLGLRNVRVEGAGMWYSKLYTTTEPQNVSGNINHPHEGNVGFEIEDNVQISNLSIWGQTKNRNTRGHGLNGRFGKNTRITNVWIEHVNVGAWVGRDYSDTPAYWNPADGLQFTGMRIRNTFADGINFSNGTRNSLVFNSSFRYTGDDALAVWANPFVKDQSVDIGHDNRFTNNTIQLPWRANGIAIYGGYSNVIEKNLVYDTMNYPGIMLATDHAPLPFSGTTSILNNGLYRCGGVFWGENQRFGAITFYAPGLPIPGIIIRDTDIVDSTYDGIQFKTGGAQMTATITNVRIDKSNNGAGILAMGGAQGSANLTNVTITNSATGNIVKEPGSQFVINILASVFKFILRG